MVSMASKATRGGVDLSHVPTVRRVTPSRLASVSWEMRRDRRIDLREFIGSVLGIQNGRDVGAAAKIALTAFYWIWAAIDC